MTKVIVLGCASDLSLSKQIKNRVMETQKVNVKTRKERQRFLISLLKHDPIYLTIKGHEKWPYSASMVKELSNRQLDWLIDNLQLYKNW